MKNSRKNLLIFGVLMLSPFLISCHNAPIEIDRESVSVNVIVNHVVSQFTPLTIEHQNPYSSDGISAQICVVAYVYDDSGHLINTYKTIVPDYDVTTVSFDVELSGTNPLIVCFSYAVYTDIDGEVYEAFSVSGQQLLSTIKVDNLLYGIYSIPWLILGGAICEVGMSTSTIDITLEPLSALVYEQWDNIHSHDEDAPRPTQYVFMIRDNDVLKVRDKKFITETSLLTDYYHTDIVYPDNHADYTRVYNMMSLFQGSTIVYGKSCYSPSNYSVEDDVEYIASGKKSTVKVEAGKQYVLHMDCSDYSVSFYEGKLK